jgi:hypothetical protein
MALTGGDSSPAGESGSVTNVKSRDAILVKADGSVVDAATISATDGIYGIDFEFTIPKTSWQAGPIKVSASDYAAYLQQLAQHDNVTAIWYAPDTNAAGLLIDTFVVVVESTSGNSDTQVEVPLSTWQGTAGYKALDLAVANLNKIEAIS